MKTPLNTQSEIHSHFHLDVPINTFAHQILFGTQLEDKLRPADLSASNDPNPTLETQRRSPIYVPEFPGRTPELSKTGKATFPSIHRLHDPIERGKILHFFANHELLALELMALALLRFPEAPVAFRKGLVGIMHEEQNHLQLYISRMTELGITFGDLPVNRYFWNCMRGMRSPLDFTVQMSLTFEQANLDFALFYMNAVKGTGDEPTALILERVFREEIGHVKHGLIWFNRWRTSESGGDTPSPLETEWEAYKRLLPRPLMPQRAKGLEFSVDARRQAGFTEDYIRELGIFAGSKGRPPVVWNFNLHCDSEIARGRPGFSAKAGSRDYKLDLEHIQMFLCKETDVVLVRHRPRMEWLESMHSAGFALPEFVVTKPGQSLSQIVLSTPSVQLEKIGGMEPWGWSPDAYLNYKAMQDRLVPVSGGNSAFCKRILNLNTYDETGLGKLFSKSWSANFLRDWMKEHPEAYTWFGNPSTDFGLVGTAYSDDSQATTAAISILRTGHPVMAKAPYGTSGMQVRKIEHERELSQSASGQTVGRWMKNVIEKQGQIIIERCLPKILDLSIQMEISETETERTHLFDARPFLTGSRNEYLGTLLGGAAFPPNTDTTRFFYSVRELWHGLLRDLGARLRNEGYRGPAGVDAFLWQSTEGKLQLKPLVELNPRWTMGRVAIELERHLAPRASAVWRMIPIREILRQGYASAATYADDVRERNPLKLVERNSDVRIESGFVFTNDPVTAKTVLSVLEVRS